MTVSKIEVSKVVIEVNGKSLELTPADARKLRDELNNLLGESSFRWPQTTIVYQQLPVQILPSPSWTPHWNVPMCGSACESPRSEFIGSMQLIN
jgi:hypothetical protein